MVAAQAGALEGAPRDFMQLRSKEFQCALRVKRRPTGRYVLNDSVGTADLSAQRFNQERALPCARLLEDFAGIVQQSKMAAIDVRPLLTAAH